MGILLTMEENTRKKPNAKSFLKSLVKIFKKDEKKEKELEAPKKEVKPKVAAPLISPSARFREKCEKLERNEKLEKIENEIAIEEIEDDQEDTARERLHPQRSRDSGFIDKEEESVDNGVTDVFSKLKIDVKANEGSLSDKKNGENIVCDDVTESLQNLKLADGKEKEKKEKKVITVTISRTPIVHKNLTSRKQAHPYAKQPSPITVNPQVLSGGQFIEVDEKIVHTALNDLLSSSVQRENELNEEENFSLITDLINDINVCTHQSRSNFQGPPTHTHVTYQQRGQGQYNTTNVYNEFDMDSILDGLGILPSVPEVDQPLYNNYPYPTTDGNPQFPNNEYHPSDDSLTANAMTYSDPVVSVFDRPSVYLTPPGSVSMGSPQSDIQFSPRAHSSDFMPSPHGRLTPIFNSDMETFQNISQVELRQSPNRVETQNVEKKMKLKEFKDMQKEINASFSNNECCQKNRKSTTEIFEERWKKFTPEERKNICLNVSRFDLRAAFGVLVRILLSIEKGSDKEDLEYVIFKSICDRVLGEHPAWFLGESAVTLLELAVLRCPKHPVLTRYLVQCVRAGRRPEGADSEANECLLPLKVDSNRDTLVIECARRGDRFAGALHWLVARAPHQPPLYPLGHCNAEGYSALHVACKMHSVASPRLQVAHVLLEHGRVDLWQPAHKGGDSALHLAVNSPACDLRLVLLLFRQVEQKQWKQLATFHNLAFVTPIEYARCAVKSKPNFPAEVLEFMKKLR